MDPSMLAAADAATAAENAGPKQSANLQVHLNALKCLALRLSVALMGLLPLPVV
jgi:hypothetical protein